MYELQSPMIPKVFESLPDTIAIAQEAMEPEPPKTAFVAFDRYKPVVKSRTYP